MKLTKIQRQRLLAGEAPRISGEGVAPVKAGETITLSKTFWITVLRVKPRRGGGWKLDYQIHDHRPRFVRRTPTDTSFGEIRASLDESGTPRPPTAERIKQAAEASSYTTSAHNAVEPVEAVDPETQERFSKEARERFNDSGRRKLEQEAADIADRLAMLTRLASEQGLDVTGDVRLMRRKLDGIKRKLGRKAA